MSEHRRKQPQPQGGGRAAVPFRSYLHPITSHDLDPPRSPPGEEGGGYTPWGIELVQDEARNTIHSDPL